MPNPLLEAQPDETQEVSAGPVPDQNAPPPPADAAAAVPAQPAPAPEAAPQAPTQEAPLMPRQLPPAQDALQRKLDDKALENDYNNGVIQPESYHHLFAKKDTMGKLGTLFGLLVGGAGSGLTHQPNVVLGMMNNEIERDLQAQKQNLANTQSWFGLAMNHEKNMADINNIQAQTEAAQMGTLLKGHEVDLAKHKNAQYGVSDVGASTQSYNNMVLNILQREQNNINRMPDGPTRLNKQNTFDTTVKPYFMQKINGNWDQYAQKRNVLEAIAPNPVQKAMQEKAAKTASQPEDEVVDPKLLNHYVTIGKMDPSMPNGLDQNIAANVTTDLKQNRQNYFAVKDYWDKLNKSATAGQLPAASMISGTLGGIGSAVGTALGLSAGPVGAVAGNGVGNAVGNLASGATSEAQKLFENERSRYIEDLSNRGLSPNEINSVLPRYNDTDAVRQKSYQMLNQIFKDRDAKIGTYLDRFPGLRKPFVPSPFQAPKPDKKEKTEGKKMTNQIDWEKFSQ